MDALPLILLGIRTAFIMDISSTSAELVYGTILWLPGEFFYSSSVAYSDPADFVSQLKSHFQSIRPQPPRPTSHSSHVTDGLGQQLLMSLCVVMASASLCSLRIRVLSLWLKRDDKFFILSMKGHTDSISLKPAHLNEDHPKSLLSAPSITDSPRTTCSGRHVHLLWTMCHEALEEEK